MPTPSPRLDEPRPIALANTIWTDRRGVHDVLDEIAAVRRWIRAVGEQINLSPAQTNSDAVTEDDAQRLIELREAIRRLAAEQTRDPRSLGESSISDQRAAMSIVNRMSAMGSVWPELTADGPSLTRREGWAGGSFVDAMMSVIARETVELIVSPQWQQLRPCVAPGCAYYFLRDSTRREWCSAVCGNRARVARHAHRHVIR